MAVSRVHWITHSLWITYPDCGVSRVHYRAFTRSSRIAGRRSESEHHLRVQEACGAEVTLVSAPANLLHSRFCSMASFAAPLRRASSRRV